VALTATTEEHANKMLFDEEKELISGEVNAFIDKNLPIRPDESVNDVFYKMIGLYEMQDAGTTAQWRAIGYRQAVADAYGVNEFKLYTLCLKAHEMLKEAEEAKYEEQ